MFGTNFILEELIYIPTREYNPMFSRPYAINASGGTIDALTGKMQEMGVANFTPAMLAGYTNEFIQPSAVPFGTAVDNNWVDNKRFIFIMKVTHVTTVGTIAKYYIQGYTDYNGITSAGAVDYNLNHFVNNIIETTVFTYNTPMGTVTNEKLTKLYNVISNKMSTGSDIYLQRPGDMISNMGDLDYFNTLEDNGFRDNMPMSTSLANLSYTLSSVDQRSLSSKLDNNVPTRYLSSVLNAGMVSSADDSFLMDYNAYSPGSKASSVNIEPSINDNPFMHKISTLSGSRFAMDHFKFSALMQIDNTIEQRFKVLNMTKQYQDPNIAMTPDVGEYWHGQDILTVKAYSIIESSVALATRYGFNKLHFICSNMMDITGQATMTITNFNSFLNVTQEDFAKLLHVFEAMFINEVFMDETAYNTMPMHIEMFVDVAGTSKINLSFCNSSSIWYTIPTFANSLFTPISTVSKTNFDNMAEMFTTAIGALSGDNQKYNNSNTY